MKAHSNTSRGRALLLVAAALLLACDPAAAAQFNLTYGGVDYGGSSGAARRAGKRSPAPPQMLPARKFRRHMATVATSPALVPRPLLTRARPATRTELSSVAAAGNSTSLVSNFSTTFWWQNAITAKVRAQRRRAGKGAPALAPLCAIGPPPAEHYWKAFQCPLRQPAAQGGCRQAWGWRTHQPPCNAVHMCTAPASRRSACLCSRTVGDPTPANPGRVLTGQRKSGHPQRGYHWALVCVRLQRVGDPVLRLQ